MEEALKQRNLPPSVDIPGEETPKAPPPARAPKPILRPSPRNNGSTLYDLYELRTMTNQLNKAILSLNSSSPTLKSYFRSPFYSQRVESIYKKNAKTKKITGSQFARGSPNERANRIGGARAPGVGFVSRLWKKVKQGLLWSKRRN